MSVIGVNSPSRLTKTLIGIPRPRKEDLVIDDGSDQDEYAKFRKPKDIDLLGERKQWTSTVRVSLSICLSVPLQ